MRERYWVEELGGSLNSLRPIRTTDEAKAQNMNSYHKNKDKEVELFLERNTMMIIRRKLNKKSSNTMKIIRKKLMKIVKSILILIMLIEKKKRRLNIPVYMGLN